MTLDDAKQYGLDRWHLQEGPWRRLFPNTYLHESVPPSPGLILEAANRRLPEGAAFSGLTAAWLLGLDVKPCEPIEVTVAADAHISARSGMKLRRCDLADGEVVRVGEMRATSIARTLRDLCIRRSLVECVVLVDMALFARLTTVARLQEAILESAGRQGIEMLRRAAVHAEPKAESPMETRTRMLCVMAGLGRPEAQVEIRDRFLKLRGRVDLYYREQRVAIEYDGATHKGSLAEDNRRQNRLVDCGIRLLRYTAGDIYGTPDLVVSQVRAALRGAPFS